MAYSLKQAADATGRTKPTILRAIQTGKISARKNELGEWEIEPAELHRVYAPVAEGDTRTTTPDEDEDEGVQLLLLRQELQAKSERIAAIEEERERERGQLTERIAELRTQLSQSEQERREKDRQLTALLTAERNAAEAVQPKRRSIFRLFQWRPYANAGKGRGEQTA